MKVVPMPPSHAHLAATQKLARSVQREDFRYVRFGHIGSRDVYVTYVGIETSPTGVHSDVIVPVTDETTAVLRKYGVVDTTARWAGR